MSEQRDTFQIIPNSTPVVFPTQHIVYRNDIVVVYWVVLQAHAGPVGVSLATAEEMSQSREPALRITLFNELGSRNEC